MKTLNQYINYERGQKFKAGENTFITKDHTIHSKLEGIVKFTRKMVQKKNTQYFETTVHVIPALQLNKTERYPQTQVYHPEQFPELEEFNPEPSNWALNQYYLNSVNRAKIEKIPFRYRGIYEQTKDYDIRDYLDESNP